MGVAQLYYHVAPHNEFGIIVKPLIRLLKSHVEIQAVVLSNIATISSDRSVSERESCVCVCACVCVRVRVCVCVCVCVCARH